jgi:hypothetical protein
VRDFILKASWKKKATVSHEILLGCDNIVYVNSFILVLLVNINWLLESLILCDELVYILIIFKE